MAKGRPRSGGAGRDLPKGRRPIGERPSRCYPRPHLPESGVHVIEEDDTDPRIARAVIGAILDEDRSGYEIWRWLGATHGSHGVDLDESNLYPTLHKMEAELLIASYWQEGERSRRVYRVATRGSTAASRQGWPPLRQPLRADPEAVAAEAGARVAGEEPTEAGEPKPAGEPGSVADFLDRLDAALRLSEPHRSDVRDEIRDHLEDSSAERAANGMKPDLARRVSVAALGSPEALANAMDAVEMTRGRLFEGMRSATMAALFGGVVGIATVGTAVLALPIAGRDVVGMLAFLGLHLYLPDTGEWRTEQIAVAAAVAAFLAARRSTPTLARTSRRAESSIRLLWAVTGAAVLALFALLIPGQLDPVTAVALLAVPVAFALGTFHAQGRHEDLLSRRGIVQASALVILLVFLPGGRLWYVAPSALPAGAPPAAGASGQLVWEAGPDISLPFVDVQGLDPQWKDPEASFWPAIKQGLALVPDPSAAGPTFTLKPRAQVPLDNAMTRSTADWLVVLTAVGPDGTRHSLSLDTHVGYVTQDKQTLLGWLLGSR